MNSPVKIAILVYNGVELVDMNGPVDVFLHANVYNGHKYQVYTVASTPAPIISEYDAVTIVPKYDLINCPEPDIIVIPGIIDREVDATLIDWLKVKAGENNGRIIMSVCIGIFILAKTGLLSGKRATTHYLAIKEFQDLYPDIELVKNVRYVEDGHFITTGGITSGIDGALYVVEKLDGPVVAQQTADVMVYNREAPLPPYTLLPPYTTI